MTSRPRIRLPLRVRSLLRAKVIAPLLVFVASLAVFAVMVVTRPSAESTRPGPVAPVVTTLTAAPGPVRLPIQAQGTVEPRTESDLVTEVAGRILWVSPQLAAGGFFDEGEVLLRIDPRDYDIALEGAAAAVARAESDLAHARADLSREKSMRKSGASSRARLEDAERDFARAAAGLREARVQLQRAQLDRERCEISAPFDGRVREKHVGLGQFVAPGAPVARVFSIDYVEVRLPISDADLAFLDLPLDAPLMGLAEGAGEDAAAPAGPQVVLSADYAGEHREWTGRVVRVEGALDARTRMLNLIARVDDPYGRRGTRAGPPLPIGLFVEASIEGRLFRDVVELPRAALRRLDTVWVVGEGDRLEYRRVELLRSIGDRSFVRSGLVAGDRVITSALDAAIDGMQVRPVQLPQPDTAS